MNVERIQALRLAIENYVDFVSMPKDKLTGEAWELCRAFEKALNHLCAGAIFIPDTPEEFLTDDVPAGAQPEGRTLLTVAEYGGASSGPWAREMLMHFRDGTRLLISGPMFDSLKTDLERADQNYKPWILEHFKSGHRDGDWFCLYCSGHVRGAAPPELGAVDAMRAHLYQNAECRRPSFYGSY